jgi:hypothetical protein
MKANRNSIGIEIDSDYCKMSLSRLQEEIDSLFCPAKLEFVSYAKEHPPALSLKERKSPHTFAKHRERKAI